MSITTDNYSTFDQAFDYFNKTLFEGKLPACMITFQNKKNSYGYFANNRYAPRKLTKNGKLDNTIHEIAMNSSAFQDRTDEEILSTLVHEMVHLWQQVYGKPGSGSYHNKEWAEMMLAVGLTPISISNPGKMTGNKVTHEITHGLSAFQEAYMQMVHEDVPNFKLEYQAVIEKPNAKAKRASKTKYTCADCGINAWAKPDTLLMCGECEMIMPKAN